ncbi:Mis12 protein-domain-containing protein [Cytidiella melzeri]|nr:Mis12 protein-domain-containing protein [Cytidiella melzeri]
MSDLPSATVPSVILPELLGFVPQFLLDDIIDTANDAVKQAVDAMEQFLERWASARRSKNADWDSTQEIEQGLVAFQTLLNTHADIAFDFFERWSLRNTFRVPPDLPLVAPHQEGLRMDRTSEEEGGLEGEIRELRRKIRAQRKLERLLTISVRLSSIQRSHSSRRLANLSFLRSPQIQTLQTLPDYFLAMYDAITSLPPSSGEDAMEQQQLVPLSDPGKRMWETSKTGYANWAVGESLARTRERQKEGRGVSGADGGGGKGESKGVVASVVAGAGGVGSTEDVRVTMMGIVNAPSSGRVHDRSMDLG